MISRVVASSRSYSDHPFRSEASEGKGWAEVYLEVPGRMEGDVMMTLPPRQRYYEDAHKVEADSEDDDEQEDLMF